MKQSRHEEVPFALVPARPTLTAPGTADRVRAYRRRARRRQPIFHPFDARYPGDPAPIKFLKLLRSDS